MAVEPSAGAMSSGGTRFAGVSSGHAAKINSRIKGIDTGLLKGYSTFSIFVIGSQSGRWIGSCWKIALISGVRYFTLMIASYE